MSQALLLNSADRVTLEQRMGCQASPTVSTSATITTGDRVVFGGIDACPRLPLVKNPGVVAGTVTVLRGTMSHVPESGGVTKDVLPTDRAASQSVAKHHRYRFTLAPGLYVVTAHYASGDNVDPWTPMIIRGRKVTKQNIPNECK